MLTDDDTFMLLTDDDTLMLLTDDDTLMLLTDDTLMLLTIDYLLTTVPVIKPDFSTSSYHNSTITGPIGMHVLYQKM